MLQRGQLFGIGRALRQHRRYGIPGRKLGQAAAISQHHGIPHRAPGVDAHPVVAVRPRADIRHEGIGRAGRQHAAVKGRIHPGDIRRGEALTMLVAEHFQKAHVCFLLRFPLPVVAAVAAYHGVGAQPQQIFQVAGFGRAPAAIGVFHLPGRADPAPHLQMQVRPVHPGTAALAAALVIKILALPQLRAHAHVGVEGVVVNKGEVQHAGAAVRQQHRGGALGVHLAVAGGIGAHAYNRHIARGKHRVAAAVAAAEIHGEGAAVAARAAALRHPQHLHGKISLLHGSFLLIPARSSRRSAYCCRCHRPSLCSCSSI